MVPASTFTVIAKVPVAPAATGLVKVHVMVPSTDGGVVHVAPAGGVMDWNVVFAGVVKMIWTCVSAQKPPTHASVLGAQLAEVVHAAAGCPFR